MEISLTQFKKGLPIYSLKKYAMVSRGSKVKIYLGSGVVISPNNLKVAGTILRKVVDLMG